MILLPPENEHTADDSNVKAVPMMYHQCLEIAEIRRMSNKELQQIFTRKDPNDKRPWPADKIRLFLRNLTADGQRFLSVEVCDNFDKEKGCLGHHLE